MRKIKRARVLFLLFIPLTLASVWAERHIAEGVAINKLSGQQNETHAFDVASQPRLAQIYGKLPLVFEANHGETDKRVKFLSRASGYTLFLTADEAVLTIAKPPQQPSKLHKRLPLHNQAVVPDYFRMSLRGANPQAVVSGTGELPGKSNYFIGNDPRQWRTNVPTYAKVKYKDIYPGVDLIYYGNQLQLEYDFVVAPAADPGAIKLSLRGAKKLCLDARGSLIMEAQSGQMRFEPPVVYQEVAGLKEAIDGHFALMAHNTVGFQVGKYDRSKRLVIDPVLTYSTYLGGTGFDFGVDIKVDGAGNAYVIGSTTSANFPTANPFQSTYGGSEDVFVSKLNASGSALVYSTYLGGSGTDGPDSSGPGLGIAIDSAANVYLTGGTSSTNFPTVNALQSALRGTQNAFVSKLNSGGSALVYSTYLGGSNVDGGGAIAVDSAGNAYVTGETSSPDFPVANPIQPTFGGPSATHGDAFVSKLNPSGSALVYSTYLGGSSDDFGDAIEVDSAGNAYVAGVTSSANFPVANALQATLHGTFSNGFVSKLNPSGSALVYSTYLGGSGHTAGLDGDEANGIAVDATGNAYVTGQTASADFPTANALQSTFRNQNSGYTAFVSKLNPSGSALVYSTYLGGSGCNTASSTETSGDDANGIALDSSGDAYVSGLTCSTDFPTVVPLQGALRGIDNAFLSKISPGGSALVFSTYLGGSTADGGSKVSVDASGNAYITGGTTSTNFPTVQPFQATLGGTGATNAFVSKITFSPAVSFSPSVLAFSPLLVGTSSATQMVTVQNTGDGQLTVIAISTGGANGGDFADSGDNCVSSSPIAPGGSCTINVKFTPTAAGNRTATLSIADNAANAPQTVSLAGTGTDFSLSAASGGSTSATVTAGQAATYNLQVNPLSGFTGSVSVACTGAPTNASCTPSASSVNVTGASSVPFSVSVPTMAHGTLPPGPLNWPGPQTRYLPALLFALFLLLALCVDRATRLGKRRYAWAFAVLFIALLASSVAGCGSGSSGGGGGGGGTPAGTYNLTVTGTSQGQNRTVGLTLTVN